ncbi:hypothetical protein [Nocardia sp. NPDC004711]
MPLLDIVYAPSRRGLRVRSALTAAAVVTVVVLLGAVVILSLLYRSLYEITAQLHTRTPAALDPVLLNASSHIEIVQIIDATGAMVRSSAAAPTRPLVAPATDAVTGLSVDGHHGPARTFTVLAAVSMIATSWTCSFRNHCMNCSPW